jgi:archaellum component FlaC/plasmid stabilization system protein ParE
MISKIERIGPFKIYTEKDRSGKQTKTVYFEYRPVVRFNPCSPQERRVACVELVELGYCNKGVAGRICGFHRNTVARLVQTKKLLGIEGLIKDDRGPKAPWKYIGDIRKGIKELLVEHPEWTDQEIAQEASRRLGEDISRSAAARIRNEGKEAKPKPKEEYSQEELMELAKKAEEIDVRRHDSRQLTLNFEADPEFAKKSEEFKQEDAPCAQTETDRQLLKRLEEGQRNVFAGSLLHSLFLEEINFQGAFGDISSKNEAFYSQEETLKGIYYGLHIGLGSIEAHKLVNSTDLGLMLGRAGSPDEATIRLKLNQMAEQNPSRKLIDYFAQAFLRQGFIDPEVFYIDGHFLPYYGLSCIAKGYFTVRRTAHKGNIIYLISDQSGRPLFSITEGCEIDFRPIIERAAERLIQYGVERPLLVFDRGGYGIHFFSQLQTKADFITWAKYLDSSQLQDIEYTSCLQGNDKRYLVGEKVKVIQESATTAKKEGRSERSQLEVRVVVFKEIDQGEPVAIYTCNTKRPAGEIVYFMLNRWGDSENLFKELLAKFNFDYHPGYDLNELKEQPLVDNPEVEIIKATVKNIKEQLGRLYYKKEQLSEGQKKKREEIEKQIEQLQQDVDRFTKKLDQLPDKVCVIDILKGQKMSLCDLEKKRIYDLIQMLAYNSRERLVEIFRSYYPDHRDVKPVLDMITRRAGYVKLHGQTLIVLLDWIQSRKHREAAQNFCHRINRMNPKLSGRMNFKLFFRVSTIPQNGG